MLLSYILGAGLVVNVCIIASASCKRASGRGCEWASGTVRVLMLSFYSV